MDKKLSSYRRLDRSKLKFSPEPISLEEALKDVIPIEWPELDALQQGKKRVVIATTYPIDACSMGFDAKYEDVTPAESEDKIDKKFEQYMSKNYKAILIMDEKETGYCAFHRELKGCITCGATIESTLQSLVDAKREWLTAAIEDGIDIPEPDCNEDSLELFTGSLDLQIDPYLHLMAVQRAYEKGISLDEYVEEAIKQAVESKQ